MNLGDTYCNLIESFPLPDGKAGETFRLAGWQKTFLHKLLGSLDPDGQRQYRKGFLFIPKKNGKSSFAAALILALLLLNKERGKQIYSAALSRDQASIVFKATKAMIEAEEFLSDRFKITDSKKLITDLKTNSIFQAMSRENKAKNGLLPSILICDEVAEWEDAAMLDLYDKLDSGMIGASEPLTIFLTTAGVSRKALGFELYQHAKQVLENPDIDPTFLPILYEAPEDSDWRDLKVWETCNPGWDVTVKPKTAQKMVEEAESIPSKITKILRYHLNIWVDNDKAWIPTDQWDSCESFDPADLKGQPCWVGCDLAATTDTTCIVLGFWLPGHKFAVVPRYYLPAQTAVLRWQKDGVNYPLWIRQNHIIETAGATCDYEYIRRDLNRLRDEYDIKAIACDPWNAQSLMTALDNDGFRVHPFRQGHQSYSPATREFERLVTSKAFLHNNHPVLTWNARNVVPRFDANSNVAPDKERSREKIDGICAALMALGMSLVDGAGTEGGSASIYESRGITCI